MNTFFDSSALVKKFILENGSDVVDEYIEESDSIFISAVTKLEAYSTIRRFLAEKRIDEEAYKKFIKELEWEFEDYKIVLFDRQVEADAKDLISDYQLKTLDAIQLSSLLQKEKEIDCFLCCDKKLCKAALGKGIKVINPLNM